MPYRSPGRTRADPTRLDGDLFVVFGLVWIASVAQLACALVGHERFGALSSFAALAVVRLPFLLKFRGQG